jgi:hypothetical protein
MSEVEVEAFVDFARAQAATNNLGGEVARAGQRQVPRERQDKDSVKPGFLQQAQLERQRGERPRGDVGPQDSHRMRFEGHNHRAGVQLRGARDDLVDDGAMRQVHAVEVADADHCRAEVVGNFFEFAEDMH